MNKIRFPIVDDELNDEINYAIMRKEWNPKGLIFERKYIEEENDCDILCDQDCSRCSENTAVTIETIQISPLKSKEKIVFERFVSHQIGHIWSSWYGPSEVRFNE